jgi:O-antigen/teichoic acid export membrane protein
MSFDSSQTLIAGENDSIKARSPMRSLAGAIAVLASGTVIGQAILLLSSPLLTRLYTPEQFGVLAVYSAIITILSTFATLGYHSVIPLPRRNDMAVNALVLALICVCAISLLCTLALSLAGNFLAGALGAPEILEAQWLIPPGILGIGALTVLTQWNVRRRSFGVIARIKVAQAASQTAVQIISAFTPVATFGLLLGNLIGQTAGISTSLRKLNQSDAHLWHHVRWKRIRFLAKHYWRFPALSIWGSLAYSANNHAPAFIMFSLFGLSTTGFYMLAQRVGMMPVVLLSTAMNQAIYRTLADSKKRPEAVGQAVAEPIRMLISLIIAPTVLAATIAPDLTGLVFGANWQEAGLYLRWMAPWPAVTLIFGVMSPVPSVMGFQKMAVFFQVTSLLMSMAAMVICGHLWGSVAAIAGFAIMKAASITLYRLHMLHLLHVPVAPIIANLILQVSFFSLCAWLAVSLYGSTGAGDSTRWGALSAVLGLAIVSYVAANLFLQFYPRKEGRSILSLKT